ncbi:hypothetical protein FB451DRAFT_1030559, partial [Mycena latifolia]
AALHGINPIIERFPMTKEGVEEGMVKFPEGRIRYRRCSWSRACNLQKNVFLQHLLLVRLLL